METIVKITWDEPQIKEWLCADNIKIALSAYCKNTIFEVNDIEPTMPSDEEIKALTLQDAQEREVLCYDGHELIMKAGIKHGLSLINA
jgi:hypothetical protein